jgi:hypothetical protein
MVNSDEQQQRPHLSSNQLSGLIEAARVNFLRSSQCGAILCVFAGNAGEDVFKRAQDADRIQIIVVADVGDAE